MLKAHQHSATESPASRVNVPAVIAVLLGVTTISLDISLTSTALPAIARSLEVAPATTIWIVNIYYLAVVASLMPLAALGEIYGHRRILILGLATFALGALVSGLSNSLPTLIGGRALLGIGSATVSATTPALVRAVYPPQRLAHGLALYALIAGVALSVGPPVTSAILAVADWRWLYLPNAIVAIFVMVLTIKALPETERNVRRFDPVSALLCSSTFACLLFAIAGAAHLGPRPVIVALVLWALTGAVLMARERGHPAPILGADLFRIPIFALSSATSMAAYSVQGLVFVSLPFLLQFRMGFTQIEAGLLIIPWPATLIVMTFISAPLTNRISPGLLCGLGLFLLSFGLVLLAMMPDDTSGAGICARLVLCGIGFGFFQSPNMIAIMQSAPASRSGSAGGVLALSRLLGQSVGAALVAFCLANWHDQGITFALWSGAALAFLAGSISALRLLPGVRNQSNPGLDL